jgi:hypothetical protein
VTEDAKDFLHNVVCAKIGGHFSALRHIEVYPMEGSISEDEALVRILPLLCRLTKGIEDVIIEEERRCVCSQSLVLTSIITILTQIECSWQP